MWGDRTPRGVLEPCAHQPLGSPGPHFSEDSEQLGPGGEQDRPLGILDARCAAKDPALEAPSPPELSSDPADPYQAHAASAGWGGSWLGSAPIQPPVRSS